LVVGVKKEDWERERKRRRRRKKMGQRKGRDYLVVLFERERIEKRKD